MIELALLLGLIRQAWHVGQGRPHTVLLFKSHPYWVDHHDNGGDIRYHS